jgi:dihydroceramidase
MTTRALGYWDQYGAPSIVDWCEPNYEVSPYVAEWWNTLSSIPMGITGLMGIWLCWRNREWLETRFLINFVAFTLVGWGSAAFHGTLLRIPQAADELPMVYSALASVYIIVLRHDFMDSNATNRQLKWGIGLSVFAVGFTAAYWTSEAWYFLLFLLIYASLITYLVIRTFYLSYTATNKTQMVWLCWTSFGIFLGGFFIMWIPEHVILPCDHSFQRIQPHSFFHGTSTTQFHWLPAPFMRKVD